MWLFALSRSLSLEPSRLWPGPMTVCQQGASLASGLLRTRDGAHLLHRPQQVILGPLLNQLAALVETVDVDACYLDALASARNSEELPLMGATEGVARCHPVPFGNLVIYSPVEVGKGVAEVLDLSLYGLRTPYLSGLTVWVQQTKSESSTSSTTSVLPWPKASSSTRRIFSLFSSDTAFS